MSIRLLTGIAALSIALAACAGSAVEQTGEGAIAVVPADQPSTIDVLTGNSNAGNILVGPNGLTLYGFTNDVEASSTCYGTCADAWPPVIVSADWTAGPGLDFGIFATTERDDGRLQLVAGQWPLYYFAGDAVPGDVNGQGSGDVWFIVDPDGRLIELGAANASGSQETSGQDGDDGATAVPVSAGDTSLGAALVDTDGRTLYGFLSDSDGLSTCNDACADAWPPASTESIELPAGLDPNIFSVVERDDGSFQLKSGVWPLYRFAGDAAPGDVNGQGSGDVWFIAAPDGSLIGNDAMADGSDGDALGTSNDTPNDTSNDGY